ncbi:hypothetical protein ACS0TY_016203 [Phlomoides rotata]
MYSSKCGILSHDSFPNSTLASLSPENFTTNQYKLLCAFSMNRRFLCTGTKNPAANQSASSKAGATQSSGPAEGSSGNKNGGQNSGGTQNTQQEGKPVRGGVILTTNANGLRLGDIFGSRHGQKGTMGMLTHRKRCHGQLKLLVKLTHSSNCSL